MFDRSSLMHPWEMLGLDWHVDSRFERGFVPRRHGMDPPFEHVTVTPCDSIPEVGHDTECMYILSVSCSGDATVH